LAGPAGGAHSASAALQQGGGTERDGVREGREGKGKKMEGRKDGRERRRGNLLHHSWGIDAPG